MQISLHSIFLTQLFLSSTSPLVVLFGCSYFDDEASLEMSGFWSKLSPHFGRRDDDEEPGDMAQTMKQNH